MSQSGSQLFLVDLSIFLLMVHWLILLQQHFEFFSFFFLASALPWGVSFMPALFTFVLWLPAVARDSSWVEAPAADELSALDLLEF